jgi:hypothetical protein
MPWFGVLPPSEHYSLDYVHYSLLGNTVRVRIPARCLQLGNHERSTGISLIWHKRLAFYLPTPLPRRDGGCGRRGQRMDLVAEASLKDIELFVDRHLVKLALGNLLFQKDKFAPEVEVCS